MNTNTHVQLMDTTLQDGEQTRNVSFSTSEKVSIAKALPWKRLLSSKARWPASSTWRRAS